MIDKTKLLEALEEDLEVYKPNENEFDRGVSYIVKKYISVIKLHAFDGEEKLQTEDEQSKFTGSLVISPDVLVWTESQYAVVDQLRTENASMKEALEWYAQLPDHAYYTDQGKRARTALSTLTKPCAD